ncbi:hypothetical protein ACEPAF_6853 [Sanghuangporus sanghuang]
MVGRAPGFAGSLLDNIFLNIFQLHVMLAVKRGLPAISRASSSRTVLNVLGILSRRFYADNSNDKDPNRNAAYSKILNAEDNADKGAKEDARSPEQGKAPDLPPRYSGVKLPPSNRVKAAPLAARPVELPRRPRPTRPSEGRTDNLSSSLVLDSEDPEPDEAARKAQEAIPDSLGGRREEESAVPTSIHYRLHVLARSKNCIMTLADENYRRALVVSSGRCKFKNVAEGTYEAGYQCALRVFQFIRNEKKRRKEGIKLHVFVNGFGQGRSALLKALTMSEGNGVRQIVEKLTDTTPIKVGGVRLQKARRL